LFLTLLFFAASGAGQAATINAASAARNDVATAIAVAVDGDTVIIPAGTASWTSGITITKGITIQGQTTTDIASGTANDQTILVDNLVRVPGGQGYFHLSPSTGSEVRISGITFTANGGDTSVMFNGAIRIGTHIPARIDHCHFTHLNHSPQVNVGAANFGVADHNVFDDYINGDFSFGIYMGDYGGQQNGDGAFAEAAGFGGPKFFFIEDNYIYYPTWDHGGGGGIDALYGGKYVFRHNRMFNATTLGHSTGTVPRARGVRAQEVYNNEWHMNNGGAIDGTTGGSMLAHDNTFYGVLQNGFGLQVYRAIWSYGSPFYGADGNSPWDYNVTESDGVTHVDGHSPYLFDSGTLSSASYPNLTDTSKNWTSNQWVGYAITRLSDHAIGLIRSNTATTITIGSWQTINFSGGDQYQIHKALRVMDQPGTGAGDLITGNTTPLNTVTGAASWPRPATEPCYSWNNTHSPGGEHVNFAPQLASFTILQGRDYYQDTPMPGYTPYAYPHPLVGGQLAAPQNLHIVPQ
jgi:hypothetical protein